MNAPTLLIGLGGTGSKIISKVSEMATPEQNKKIAYAVFDTDINELRKIQENCPFINTIQTSTKQTVGEYLNKDTHARDTWFPVNAILNGKTLTEGAGQVRSISRLALETSIRAGKMEPLHQAIQSLYKVEEDKIDQALKVVIVSSLAGGTGSGLILPVALYVRNYLQTHFRQSANITRGFFILPEVFYEVIEGQTERNNLKANAYATLRELDAFLMKGDATLDDRYSNTVKYEFPRVASEGYEEYDVRPYDFCFLFDAQNADGSKLNSFDQYLEHAANCIYAQSIGPMNKRSNSSEDNTIRKLAKERGRNRYAGAGASMLVYPFEDIKTFLALNWAKQCVTDKWLIYDINYKEQCKLNAQKKEQGIMVKEQSLSSYYVNQIEQDAKHDNVFAQAIVRASGTYENGVTRLSDKWMEYVTAVLRKIEVDMSEGSSELTAQEENVQECISNLGNEWEEYASVYNELKKYKAIADGYTELASQAIAFAMYKGERSKDEEDQEYRLETYLKNSDRKFLHPNAIRYVLTKILVLMKASKENIERDREATDEFFYNFEKSTFDDSSTEETEGVESLSDRKLSLLAKLTKRPTSDQEDIKRKYRNYSNMVQEGIIQKAQIYILEKGIEHVDSLLSAFEGFYGSFESKVDTLDKGIESIYKKYSNRVGTTVRYVCSSRICLDKILDKKPYTGSYISIDDELAKEIYYKVLEYSLKKDKPNNNRYFNDLFDKGIIGYFKNSVMRSYGSDLDVDIITAIENEADYKGDFEEKDDAYELIDQYVKKTINDTRKLSCPFIESPLGEPREPIDACTFNDELKPDKGDDSPRANLIRSELMNHGGEPDKDIEKNVIMFYQSFYGLRANDLSKFAPPEKSATYNRSSGEYFKAYYELVGGIHPESWRSKEISPHIDRTWHIVTKMPDLDEENQRRQEYDIYAAFFWAIIRGYIYMIDEGHEKKIYKLKNISLKMDNDSLIVSNGTECDKLYEVLDAIAIYPELVEKILANIREMTRDDLNEDADIKNGILYSALESYRIEEPGIGRDRKPSQSIFDIPLLMKKSSTPDIYYEADVVELLKVEINEIRKYFSVFVSPKELPNVMGGLIKEQFNLHLKALEEENEINKTLYNESLFDKTCEVIVDSLLELGLRRDAENIRKCAEQLKRSEE